jgi:cell division protein FtsL
MKDDFSASGSMSASGSGSGSDPFVLLPRATTNSRVVREVDPRASRNLWLVLCLVGGVVGGMVLYAWPRVHALHLDTQTQQQQMQKERLVEQNRKLRLEKAVYEGLDRVQVTATRDLGLGEPAPERVYVIEQAPPPPGAGRVAEAPANGAPRVN